MFRAVVVAAMLALLFGCVRPQGTKALQNIAQSPSPVAVAHAPLTIANPAFHSGEVGVTYAPITLSATGGLPPYTWAVVGSLPGGLTLSSDGIVSGTPNQNGYFVFSVQVLDFGSNDTAGVPANIPIVPRLTASLVSGCATECTVELGCVTVCGNFGQVSGGVAPITYSRTSGSLPAGTSLNGLSLNGTFTGLPGRLQFTVQVTDGFGATTLITARYNLLPHISVGPSATCGPVYYVTGCNTAVPYSGGTSPTVKITGASATLCTRTVTGAITCGPSSTLPPGFSTTASGGSVSISVPGGSQYYYTYLGNVTFILVDQSLCSAGTNCASSTSTVRVDLNGG